MTEAEQVLIRGKVFLYKQKAPFVPSGKSVLGALEYDEVEDKVRCHECGGWFRGLGIHAEHSHGISAFEYKRKHGLRQRGSLSSLGCTQKASGRKNAYPPSPETIRLLSAKGTAASAAARASRIKSGESAALRMEKRNELGTCHAQILERLRTLANRLGRAPTQSEIRSDGLCTKSIQLAFNTYSINSVITLAGLIPLTQRDVSQMRLKYNKEALVEMLRDFYVKWQRLPRCRDHKNLLPARSTFVYYFGSIVAAYEAAGLGSVAKQATA